MLLLVPASIGLALFMNRFMSSRPLWRYTVLLLACLCLLEQGETGPSYDKFAIRKDVEKIASRIDPNCQAFFVSRAGDSIPVWKTQLDAMWAEWLTGIPTLNGYSGNLPKNWDLFFNIKTPEDEQRLGNVLETWLQRYQLDSSRICLIRMED